MPPLPDELVEEIFLRLPLDEPAALLRASLVSKPWFGVLTGPGFCGRYRELHGTPPMLGFLYSRPDGSGDDDEDPAMLFVSTSKFWVRFPDFTESTHHRLDAWDCRHGRVLLRDNDNYPMMLVVWDPLTGCAWELYGPDGGADSYEIAVLCAMSGCDHRACHAAPFKVVYVRVDNSEEGECVAHACVLSLDTSDWGNPRPYFWYEWKEPCPGLGLAAADAFIRPMPSVLVNDALHFLLGYRYDDDRVGILKYSLSSDSLSLIDAPIAESVAVHAPILMAMKDGSLGFAHVDRLTLYAWSRQIDSNGVVSWINYRLVDLKNLLPIKNPKITPRLIGSVEGGDIIFVNTDLGIYEIDLKTLEWKARLRRENLHSLIPYMSFYNPLGITMSFFFYDS
ncbi:hypothetical protein VPH35_120363 [Triticum aestivum]